MKNLFAQKVFKIIHIDMDCFYAQVEMRDNPTLQGRPVAIGGPSKKQGVLCTSNYEARAFGVKAAQSTFQAFQLCPELVLIPPDFVKYKAVSAIINEIYYGYSDHVQSISLDEAYLDVTEVEGFGGSATLIAESIKNDILTHTGLTASAGVSFNKMLAKIASDWEKPNGLFVITPAMREAFMRDLPLSKIPGIGKVSTKKYETMGFTTCGDITRYDLFKLISLLGKRTALDLYKKCQGISNSSVKGQRQKKSFGIEHTFFEPLVGQENLLKEVGVLIDRYNIRLKTLDNFHLKNREISHLSIKLRFNDFSTYTKELPIDTTHSRAIIATRHIDHAAYNKFMLLFNAMTNSNEKAIRLIGIGMRFRDAPFEQLVFNWA